MSDQYWSQENIIGTGAGIGSSVKIVDNNTLVFGAFDNFIYALNSENGKISWKFKTNGPVYSTPAVDKNRIYAGSCDGFLYCIDHSGNFLWKFDSHGRIMNTSIICANGKILFGNDNGTFFALDQDGHLLWKFQAGDAIRTTPAVVNDKIIFGSHDRKMYCLNDRGQMKWKFETGGAMWTCPAITNPDGKLLWSINSQNIKQSDDFLVYFGCFDGGLYCIDQSGNFKWKFHTNGPNTSEPVFEDGRIYIGSSDGYLYAIDRLNRNLYWKYKTIGRIGHSSPVITKENIFICDFVIDETSTGGNLHCLNKDGELDWRFSTANAIVSTPLIHKNTVFFGSYDGFLYAISLKRRELLWKFRTLFEKINFDALTSVKHMELEEERSKNILTTWTPEISKQKPDGYEKQTLGYTANITMYGSSSGIEKFSYTDNRRKKGVYTDRSGYE